MWIPLIYLTHGIRTSTDGEQVRRINKWKQENPWFVAYQQEELYHLYEKEIQMMMFRNITPSEVEVVEISDEEEEDMVELSSDEYKRNIGYLIRVEESEDDIEPEYRRMLEKMVDEERKLREEKFKVLKSGVKLEDRQSSKGDGKRRKRGS
ncbi:hypothetical protein Bca52824_035714 [Brassica carinata]|uniref:Uncharacterized protein n=1 Tax=Brassica carinata TaxID=52824 RepID=A0A8X7S3P0_BRACI|nr:hypothetical protein Bca52824_035714 [Brassica carinata]